jgi:hypothetical protein
MLVFCLLFVILVPDGTAPISKWFYVCDRYTYPSLTCQYKRRGYSNQHSMPYAHGIGFAVPINIAKTVMTELIQNGRVIYHINESLWYNLKAEWSLWKSFKKIGKQGICSSPVKVEISVLWLNLVDESIISLPLVWHKYEGTTSMRKPCQIRSKAHMKESKVFDGERKKCPRLVQLLQTSYGDITDAFTRWRLCNISSHYVFPGQLPVSREDCIRIFQKPTFGTICMLVKTRQKYNVL